MTAAIEGDLTAQIIDQACAAGLKRGQPYPIEFAFFGDHDRLRQLRTEMLAAGYTEDTSQTDEMLVFGRLLPLDTAQIEAAKVEMQALATKYSVALDGRSVSAGSNSTSSSPTTSA